MPLATLRTLLALWRRRHAFRQQRLDIAHQRNDKPRIEKWQRLRREAAAQIREREAQIAKRTRPTPRQRAVSYAKSFAGVVREVPYGSNSGGIITTWQRRLGFSRAPWCGIFAGCMLLRAGLGGVTARIASVGAIEDDAKARRGCFRGWTTNPRNAYTGDLAVLFGYGRHVELVDHVDLKRGVVYTIGGNTSSGSGGSQSNGGGVYRRTRPLSVVRGFALVNYPS